MFGASDYTIEYAASYITVYLLGTVFVELSVGLNTFISCQGYARTAMISVLIGAIVNIILDPVFIFVLDMGVVGAATATVISQALSAVWVLRFLISAKSQIHLRISDLKPDVKILGSILALGVSPFIMAATESAITIVMNHGLQTYGGDLYVGSMTILQSVLQLIFVPINGFTNGVQPIISYNYGLNESQRVRRAYLLALKTAIGCGVCFALTTIFCSPEIVGMFIDRSYPAYDIAVKGLPLYATGFVFFAVNIVSIGYFQSVERAKYATVITLLRGFILLTACFFGLPLLLGDRGIWLATPLAEMLTTLFILVIYISGKKEHKEKSVSLDKMGCTPT